MPANARSTLSTAGTLPAACEHWRVDKLPDGVMRVRADNPSPLTLDGTNTYVVGRWVVDPGPDDEAHLAAVVEAAGGSIEQIVLTHDHIDHSEGAPALAERTGAEVIRPRGGERIGPF